MSSSRRPRFRQANLPMRLALGALAVVLVPLFFLRLLPLIVPYSGQKALDSVRFSLVIQDREGQELQVLPLKDGLRRVFLPASKLPPALARVVTGAEDRRFWLHPGFDLFALIRALGQNSSAGETVSGASTISMQLARLLQPHPRTPAGKLLEIWEALQLESRLGKAGVLELYVNLVPFGQNVEGFAAASRAFFGKPVAELSLQELSVLAVVPRSPGIYNPFLHAGSNEQAVSLLRSAIFSRQEILGSKPQVLDPGRPFVWPFRAPHYVRWLSGLSELAEADGRMPIRTSIEPALQNYLESIVAHTVDDARKKRVSNAASFFVRPSTMEIAAWVGSSDFSNDQTQGQIDGVTMRRQPGSTLKPFLYSLALENGFTAATVLPDVPTDFGGAEVYTPANFNDQFNGPVRLRQALASSLNVPAVYTLQRIGVLPFTDLLISAGFHSLETQRGHLGLGLALGNAEISLYELVQAYGMFLHAGDWRPLVPFSHFSSGEQSKPALIDPRVASLIRDILTRHPDRTLAFGHGGNTRLSFEGAIKTGTSNQFNNIWAVGFTTDLLGGVWMGNFTGATVVGTADSGFPASILSKTLEAFSKHESFPPLKGLERHRICSVSGLGATENCPFSMEEWFLPGTAPPPCDWHGASGTVRYPQEYQTWLAKYRYRTGGEFLDSEVHILRPRDGAVFFVDPTLPASGQQLAVQATGSGNGSVLIDGRSVYRGRFPMRTWIPLTKGTHRLSIASDLGNEDDVQFEVR